MPNWAINKLTVKGKSQDIDSLLNFIKGKDEEGNDIPFDFNKVVPMPKELLETPSPVRNEHKKRQHLLQYGSTDWYEWRLQNWGTKWNLDDEIDIDIDCPTPNLATFSFNTAWSPPIKIVEALGKRFSNLEFCLTYCELGNGFAGSYEIHGDKENDTYYDSENPSEYSEFVKNEFGFDDFFEEQEE